MIDIVFGIVLSVLTPGDANADPVGVIFKGVMTGNKIYQKEKNKEMDDSIHEETYQIVKDAIREAGEQ